ncbi:MAG TPA: hypothetical protein VFE24_01985 [Pirellulales bacterium]|jgi:hypothetical protein|nr:hypothetical protein [Pirellulales bacterium]
MIRTLKPRRNPFYALLFITGVLFVLTCCTYGVMTLRDISGAKQSAPAAADNPGGERLLDFFRHNGLYLLSGELVVLAIGTFGAIWLDSIREPRRQAAPIAPKTE